MEEKTNRIKIIQSIEDDRTKGRRMNGSIKNRVKDALLKLNGN